MQVICFLNITGINHVQSNFVLRWIGIDSLW